MDDNNPDSLEEAAMALIPESKKEDIRKLAAVGVSPRDIVVMAKLTPDEASVFLSLVDVPGSPVDRLIAEGRAAGAAIPQIKLQEAAAAGNIDAIRTLQKLQAQNRFNELLYYMDEDEFAG